MVIYLIWPKSLSREETLAVVVFTGTNPVGWQLVLQSKLELIPSRMDSSYNSHFGSVIRSVRALRRLRNNHRSCLQPAMVIHILWKLALVRLDALARVPLPIEQSQAKLHPTIGIQSCRNLHGEVSRRLSLHARRLQRHSHTNNEQAQQRTQSRTTTSNHPTTPSPHPTRDANDLGEAAHYPNLAAPVI